MIVFTDVVAWFTPAHLAEIGAAGFILGKLAQRLPDSFKYKKQIVNLLHGLFPSWDVIVRGITDPRLASALDTLAKSVNDPSKTIATVAKDLGPNPNLNCEGK